MSDLYRQATDSEVLCDEEPMPDADTCQHKWKWVNDWYGDASIPNGTCDCSGWVCQECGSTECEDDPPEDGPDPDEYRERMEDGRQK